MVISIVKERGKPFKWLALMLEGERQIEVAWRARGNGFVNTVTTEGWNGFTEHLALARQSLTKAWELRPDLAAAPARMIYVALGDSDLTEMRYGLIALSRSKSITAGHGVTCVGGCGPAGTATRTPCWHLGSRPSAPAALTRTFPASSLTRFPIWNQNLMWHVAHTFTVTRTSGPTCKRCTKAISRSHRRPGCVMVGAVRTPS